MPRFKSLRKSHTIIGHFEFEICRKLWLWSWFGRCWWCTSGNKVPTVTFNHKLPHAWTPCSLLLKIASQVFCAFLRCRSEGLDWMDSRVMVCEFGLPIAFAETLPTRTMTAVLTWSCHLRATNYSDMLLAVLQVFCCRCCFVACTELLGESCISL